MMEVLMKGIAKRPDEKVCYLIQSLGVIAETCVADSSSLAMD